MSVLILMKRNAVIVICVIAVLLLVFYLTKNDSKDKICFEDNCFFIEVVSTPAEREKGLMFKDSLDKNKGMLFVFESEGSYPFWMKNTLIPLDMIWMDSSGKIVDIAEADPCTEDPCFVYYHAESAKYVLEINKGLSSELGIMIGQMAESKLIA